MVPEHPYRLLRSPAGITAGLFHPQDRNALLGGLSNGHVGVWDLTAGSGALTEAAAGLAGSALRVAGLQWVESATLSGILGVSADGIASLWGQTAVLDPLLSVDLNTLVFCTSQS